jgi:hypothetical protein
MRQSNGIYTQRFNWRHDLVWLLFQGRFKAILVDRDAYLLALCRYVERNPVAARMVAEPTEWPWSSCRAHLGQTQTPPWLDSDGVHGYLIGRPVSSMADRLTAIRQHAEHIVQTQDSDASFWNGTLRNQVCLGDESFVESMHAKAEPQRVAHQAIPKAQRLRSLSWQDCLAQCQGDRARALHRAYREGGAPMTALAQQAGLSVTHVSRLIATVESEVKGET